MEKFSFAFVKLKILRAEVNNSLPVTWIFKNISCVSLIPGSYVAMCRLLFTLMMKSVDFDTRNIDCATIGALPRQRHSGLKRLPMTIIVLNEEGL